MFEWLWGRPICPVNTREKAWTEWRMLWLSEAFGSSRLNGEVLLPDARLFPEPYRGSLDDAHRTLDRLAAHVGIDRAGIQLAFRPAEDDRDPAGRIVHVDPSLIVDRELMAAVMLRELALILLADKLD